MKTIGIIGCGNMGEAILRGIISTNIVRAKNIFISDINSSQLDCIKNAYKVNVGFNNSIVAKSSDVIILAVKPQDMASTLAGISQELNKKKLLISIAAGMKTKKILSFLDNNVPVVRVMPNMPALIGKGVSAISKDSASARHRKDAGRIFSSIGEVVEIREKDFDAVTAISGSGPAYFFYLVEVLIKSAVKLGLKKDVARKLAVKTAYGSVCLLDQLKQDPASLRKKVTSKGGTTEAVFKLFKKKNLDKIFEEGIKKASQRSKELGR